MEQCYHSNIRTPNVLINCSLLHCAQTRRCTCCKDFITNFPTQNKKTCGFVQNFKPFPNCSPVGFFCCCLFQIFQQCAVKYVALFMKMNEQIYVQWVSFGLVQKPIVNKRVSTAFRIHNSTRVHVQSRKIIGNICCFSVLVFSLCIP